MANPYSCPHWEIDPHQIFPWVQICRWFAGCSGCRLDEIEVCRCQGLKSTSGVRDLSAKSAST